MKPREMHTRITSSLGHIIPHILGSRNGIGSYHTTI